MTFHASNEKGKYGEEITQNFLRARGCTVLDVSAHPFFQTNGVDIVFEKDKNPGLMDIKTDYYKCTGPHPNFFVETVANCTLEKPGCIYSTNADWWLYYRVQEDTAYLFTPDDMREHIQNNDFKEVPTQTRVGQDAFYETRGLLVPIEGSPVQATYEKYSRYIDKLYKPE